MGVIASRAQNSCLEPKLGDLTCRSVFISSGLSRGNLL